MKKLNQVLLNVLFVCSIIACNSDDDTVEKINETFINGTWQLAETTINGSANQLSTCEKTNSLQFNNSTNEVIIINHEIGNADCEISENLIDDYIINNETLVFNGISYTILSLSENNTLRLGFVDGDNTMVNSYERQ
ncbi:lipocalin family protein [uncultured Winogradskyella sp.]|uniref:lipocalin family protein n=1 Tax=uncultured Winogradskyella sp. TaxID=395353 RepID=UPI002610F810|nr:lipocalin family protein [uncultured Winogradskyella sp.]